MSTKNRFKHELYRDIIGEVASYEEEKFTTSDISDRFEIRSQDIGLYIREINDLFLEDELEIVNSGPKTWRINSREKLENKAETFNYEKPEEAEPLERAENYLRRNKTTSHDDLANIINSSLTNPHPSKAPDKLRRTGQIIDKLEEENKIEGNVRDGYTYTGQDLS